MTAAAPRPRGRRAGDPDVTRRQILDAARAAFAAEGYERATIRAIAERADVDPALVHHHFGSKEELFVAAVELPFEPRLIESALAATEGSMGERLARVYLTSVLGGRRVESLVRSAVSNDTARAMLREFVERAVLDPFEKYLDGPERRLRLALAGSQMLGLVMLRQIVGLDVLAAADVDHIVEMVAPALDRHLGG